MASGFSFLVQGMTVGEALETGCFFRSCLECTLGDRMLCKLLPDELEALRSESLGVMFQRMQSCLILLSMPQQLMTQRNTSELPIPMHTDDDVCLGR
jgi:hypothetical protein